MKGRLFYLSKRFESSILKLVRHIYNAVKWCQFGQHKIRNLGHVSRHCRKSSYIKHTLSLAAFKIYFIVNISLVICHLIFCQQQTWQGHMFMFSKIIVSFLGIEIWPMVVWLCLCLELGITCISKACTGYFTLFVVCVPFFVQMAQQMVMGMKLNWKLPSEGSLLLLQNCWRPWKMPRLENLSEVASVQIVFLGFTIQLKKRP